MPRTEGQSGSVIDDSVIARLVDTFYARVRDDPMLGPIFEQRVEDWPSHLATLRDFWSSVVLRSGRYNGRPLPLHIALPIEAAHFDRWLELFEKTTNEIMPPEQAGLFVERARRIADSLELGVEIDRGRIATPRHAR